MEERITAVEAKLAYLEDFVNQLQSVVVEQGRTLEHLKEENKILAVRLRELHSSSEEIPDRKPPHY